ncbi:MAG: hypothetical protein ACOYBY_11250 [Dermatophilaceae bacterium]
MRTYVGRHRPAHSQQAITPGPPGRPRAGRPSMHSVTALALVGAGVAGFLSVNADATSAEVSTVSLGADQLQELNASVDPAEADADRAEANNQATRRVTAAAGAAQAAAAEAARLDAQRQAAADRAARDAQREATAANARSDPRSAARAMLGDFGWDEGQFSCLDRLWQKESKWSYTATNASSGAYGIPQALPGSKMGSVASDWRTNPLTQITWGLQYIRGSYGTPCSAWSHSVSNNWY